MKTNKQTTKLAIISMLCAVSIVLFYIQIPFPMAAHLKIDFSDIPALFAGIVYGPMTAVLIEFMKNLIEFATEGLAAQMGFGNIMNFIVGCAYIVPFSVIYKKLKAKNVALNKNLIICSVVSTVSIIFFGFLGNYFIAPLYFSMFLGTELSSEALWVAIGSATTLNAIKGVMLSVVSFPIVSVLIKRIKTILG